MLRAAAAPTRLHIVHIGAASEAFFYQQALRRWGNLAAIRFEEPVALSDLYILALGQRGADEAVRDGNELQMGWAEEGSEPPQQLPRVTFDAPPSTAALKAAASAAAMLEGKAEMLAEYLAVEISSGAIHALPQLIDGYVPPLNGLPTFVYGLVHLVDWTAEQPCFEGIARRLATLYRIDRVGDDDADSDAEDGGGDGGATHGGGGDGTARSEAWTIQHVLLPAMRRSYEPPQAHGTNGAIVQVACTEQLYKIFERC